MTIYDSIFLSKKFLQRCRPSDQKKWNSGCFLTEKMIKNNLSSSKIVTKNNTFLSNFQSNYDRSLKLFEQKETTFTLILTDLSLDSQIYSNVIII